MEKHKLDLMNERLGTCVLTAQVLKTAFPNDLMKIKTDTILPCIVSNKRKLGIKKKRGMGGSDAFYHNETHRIAIKPKILIELPPMDRTKVTNQADRIKLYGKFALVELMCHELAHHRTKGHAKGFKQKYYKFLKYMSELIVDATNPNNLLSDGEDDIKQARIELERLKDLIV